MKFETMKANTSELQQGFDELMTYKLSVFRICLGYEKTPGKQKTWPRIPT
jgi:hypothetical protein